MFVDYDNPEFIAGDIAGIDLSGFDQKPAVAELADGGFIVVWYTSFYNSGNINSHIHAQIFNEDGSLRGDSFVVNDTVGGLAREIDVTGLADGGFAITWSISSGRTSVHAKQYDGNAEPVGTDFQVSALTNGDFTSPSIIGTADGGYIILHDSQFNDGDLVAQVYDADGNNIKTVTLNSELTSFPIQNNPHMVLLDDGSIMVVWESYDRSTDSYEIMGRQFDAQLNPLGDAFQINVQTNAHQDNPVVEALDGGGFAVSWSTFNVGTSSHVISARVFDAAMSPVSSEISVGSTRFVGSYDLTRLEGGGFTVVYQLAEASGSLYSVGQRYDENGAVIGDTYRVSAQDPEFIEGYPSTLTLSDGRVLVSWEAYNFDGSNVQGTYIAARFFNSEMTPIDPADMANIFYPTNGDDFFAGTPDADIVDGWAGNDVLIGGAGNDILIGGDGADTLIGGAGDDQLFGGAGDDTLWAGEGNDILQGGDGFDTANFAGSMTDYEIVSNPDGTYSVIDVSGLHGGGTTIIFSDIEALYFGDESFVFGPSDEQLLAGMTITLHGTEGADTLSGNTKKDVIASGSGDDIIQGGGDSDFIVAGTGADTVNGGAGSDTIYGGWGSDTLDGSIGNDTLNGGAGSDMLSGGAGRDTLYGGLDDDRLDGGINNDRLYGELGNDALNGGKGNDQLNGGHGDDLLVGGKGYDTAIYSGNLGDYLIEWNGSDSFTVTDQRSSGADGVDILFGIEELQFADTVVATDIYQDVALASDIFDVNITVDDYWV